jgi:hypothetical protein
LTQNKAKFLKKLIITLVFKENANFFAENWKKSQKIVIITSTPGCYSAWVVNVGLAFETGSKKNSIPTVTKPDISQVV